MILRILPYLAALYLTACCVPGRPFESLKVVQDIAAAGANPTALTRSTAEPTRKSVQYRSRGRTRGGDLYVPGDRAPEAGIVLVPGVARKGYRDPRLVALANTLARARFAVLVPDLPNVRRLKVGPEDAHEIAMAFQYLAAQSVLAPKGRAGLAAASYAVGPAVLAAMEPGVRDKVRFVMGVGGYYDITEVLTFAITGYYRDTTKRDAQWQKMEPSEYAKWVFLLSNLERIPDARDRGLLRQIAETKLENPRAKVSVPARRLGPQGKTFYELLTEKDPERISARMEELPAPVRKDVEALNLASKDLTQLNAELILIHGRNDNSIPYTESKALAAAAPRSRLFLINNLAHVDIEKGGLTDALRLWCAIDELLSYRR
jgi:pimeloyl-ACP methyl ester carboxylesterase